MVSRIKKRDGRIEPFCKGKIVNAICKAMARAKQDDMAAVNRIADEISASPVDMLTVEQVQDMVEMKLMKTSLKQTAKEYILYRAERTRQREMKSAIVNRVWEKTSGSNVENANANVDERTFGGRKNEAASIIQKMIALDSAISEEVAQAHKDGLIYEHDLDFYNVGAHNCLNIDFEHIFTNGFKTRNCDVRPPSSFSTACQLVAVAMQLQSQCQFGGVGSVHSDTDLAPYVRKSFLKHFNTGLRYVEGLDLAYMGDRSIDDPTYKEYPKVYEYAMDMLEKEGRQSAQALWHNLGTLESRAGSQVNVA